MSRIPKEAIDQIMARIDIVEVVGDFVSLKKKGQNLWAPCPFHNEKSPSFSVSPAKGIYKCFGCGKAGNAIQFVMDIEGGGYVEALKYLANKYHIEIAEEVTPEAVQAQSERDSQYILSEFAQDHFVKQLHENDEGKSIGLPYLKERGLSQTTIKKFQLGYSLNSWDSLTNAALQKGFDQKFLEATGLTVVKDDKRYDRFRGRVMFPIHNVSGRVVGFGARTLKKNDKKTPKYLNSPESEIYHKSNILYGMYQAKNAIRIQDECYLVEGYLDVLSLHQGGIENVVASSGTSLTEGQIKLISRYSQNVTVLYDGDAAGIKASLRGIDLILEGGLNVNVVLFPEGEDPDSYIHKVGDEAFLAYLKQNSKDFISFKAELFAQEAKENPVKKAEAIKEIVHSIAKIPDNIKRSVFLKQCSLIFDIDEQLLIAEYNKIHLAERKSQQGASQVPPPPPPPFGLPEAPPEIYEEEDNEVNTDLKSLHNYEREVVRLLISYPAEVVEEQQTLSQYVIDQVDDVEFKNPVFARLIELCKTKIENGNLPSTEEFVNHPENDIRNAAINLLSEKHELSDKWETHEIFVPREKDLLLYGVERAVLRLKWRNVQLLIKENMDSLPTLKSDQEVIECMTMLKNLKEFEKSIAEMLGIVVSR